MFFIANFSHFWVTNYKGELAALLAAFLWAVSTLVWTKVGQRIPPLELNFIKGAIAIVFLLLTIFLQGQWLVKISTLAFGLLSLSGVIGIAIADTALFSALNCLGARRTLLLKILTSPIVAILALIFLGEKLAIFAWCGIFLTILGVAWVISERVPGTNEQNQHLLTGIGWAMVSTFGDAIGAILSRTALTQTTISPLWSTLIRLSTGGLIMLIWLLFKETKSKGNQILLAKSLWSVNLVAIISLTSFVSTYLGIWLQQISFKFAAVGIAQTLLATSPLFVLPIAIWQGEQVSFRAFFGVIVALVGVALLFSV